MKNTQNKINRLEMVIATEKRQTKELLEDKSDGIKFTNKLYNLTYTDTLNSNFKLTRVKITVDWAKTAKYYKEKVKNYDEWVSYILVRKENECAELKYNIDFSESENYTSAVNKGRGLKKTDDYILIVEAQIEEIKLLSLVDDIDYEDVDTENEHKKELRSEIKSLGGKSQGLKTVEKLKEKLEGLKESTGDTDTED